MKKISIRNVAAIKRNAQNIAPLVRKKQSIMEQVAKLKEEFEAINAQIEGFDAGTRAITGTELSSEVLVNKVVKATGKFDKDGKEIKVTSYVPNPERLKLSADEKYYELIEDEDILVVKKEQDSEDDMQVESEKNPEDNQD